MQDISRMSPPTSSDCLQTHNLPGLSDSDRVQHSSNFSPSKQIKGKERNEPCTECTDCTERFNFLSLVKVDSDEDKIITRGATTNYTRRDWTV